MEAIIVRKPFEVTLEDIEIPSIETPYDVIVQVEGCGVCGTDFHLFQGLEFARYPVIPGHEFVGKVVRTGDKASSMFGIGQRVVIDPNLPCLACEACRKGDIHLCSNPVNMGVNVDGAFAKFVKVDYRQCYPISESVTTEIAILAEPISCVLHGIETSSIQFHESALIIGGGPIGLLFYKIMYEVFGVQDIEIVEINEARIKLARNLGIEKINKEPSKTQYDVVIEASGTSNGFALGISRLKPRGRIVQFGAPPEDAYGNVPLYKLYKGELRILGSFTNPFTMQKAVSILENKGEIFHGIVTKEITLEELKDLLKHPQDAKNELKIMVRI
jgi:hypothetical protein